MVHASDRLCVGPIAVVGGCMHQIGVLASFVQSAFGISQERATFETPLALGTSPHCRSGWVHAPCTENAPVSIRGSKMDPTVSGWRDGCSRWGVDSDGPLMPVTVLKGGSDRPVLEGPRGWLAGWASLLLYIGGLTVVVMCPSGSRGRLRAAVRGGTPAAAGGGGAEAGPAAAAAVAAAG